MIGDETQALFFARVFWRPAAAAVKVFACRAPGRFVWLSTTTQIRLLFVPVHDHRIMVVHDHTARGPSLLSLEGRDKGVA